MNITSAQAGYYGIPLRRSFTYCPGGGLPIAAGENLRTLHEFQQMISRVGVSFPMPDCSKIGGMTAWIKVAEMANKHGLPVTSHGVPELHVHLLAAVPNASYLEVHGFGLDRFMKQALQFEDGKALVPRRPGHGVGFHWEALKAHGQQP
jgi:L-alanine-DL-glutamate epimerase-like enolase superfamily enzyme